MMTKAERVYDPYEAVEYRKRHMGGPQGKAVYKMPAVESTISHLRRPETITPWKKEANVTEMPPQVSRLPPSVTTKATRYKIVANENIKFPPGLVRSPEQRQIVKRVPIVDDDDEMERPEGIDSVTYKRFSNLVKKHQRNAGEESPRTPRRSEEDYYENDLTPVARLARTAGRGR